MTEADETAILDALDRFGRALFEQDLETMLDLVADRPGVTIIPSEGLAVHAGREAVAAFLQRICSMQRRYEWRWRDRRVVAASADLATYVAVGEEGVFDPGGSTHAVPYVMTGTVVHEQGQWRFLVLHSSEAPPG